MKTGNILKVRLQFILQIYFIRMYCFCCVSFIRRYNKTQLKENGAFIVGSIFKIFLMGPFLSSAFEFVTILFLFLYCFFICEACGVVCHLGWKGKVLTTGLPRKSPAIIFNEQNLKSWGHFWQFSPGLRLIAVGGAVTGFFWFPCCFFSTLSREFSLNNFNHELTNWKETGNCSHCCCHWSTDCNSSDTLATHLWISPRLPGSAPSQGNLSEGVTLRLNWNRAFVSAPPSFLHPIWPLLVSDLFCFDTMWELGNTAVPRLGLHINNTICIIKAVGFSSSPTYCGKTIKEKELW